MQVGYMPYTYDAPDWAEQQFHIPEKVTVNWGEVIVGAVIGALLTRVLR